MTIGDDGIASICMGKEHDGDPCERCGHHGPHSRESEEQELGFYVTSSFTAKCVNCGLRECLDTDGAQEAVCALYEEGWRVRGSKVYCKKCVVPLRNEGTRYLKKDMGVWLD